MENVSHKLNMQIEANFKEDFFEEEQGVVEKYFFHGDVLLTLNHVQNDLQLFRCSDLYDDQLMPLDIDLLECAQKQKQQLHLSSSGRVNCIATDRSISIWICAGTAGARSISIIWQPDGNLLRSLSYVRATLKMSG